MEENDQADDFDDFFDTPGRSVGDSEISIVKSEQNRDSKSTKDPPTKKQNRNNSASSPGKKSSISSDHDASPYYSSDSVTESESDSDTDSRSRRRKKQSSRSKSSSRSGGSDSSETSYSSDESEESRSRSSRKKGRLSRSRSVSTDSSESRTVTPDSTTQKRKKDKKDERRDSYSSATTSGTYSKERKRSHSPRPKQASQAWGSEEVTANRRQDRPKTAKRLSSEGKPARQKQSHRQECNGKSYADDTESDMTDVSPIASPRNGSVNGHAKEQRDKVPKSKPPVYQAMPLGVEDSGSSNVQDPDPGTLDLDILMKAVSELEKQKRIKSNTRRVMFEPLRSRPTEKSNYTFSSDDTHRIEQENKRLLRQIMRQVQASSGKQPPKKDLRVQQSTLTTSAINRRREQQRIENENLAFLKRLQKIKPSRGLSRNEQLESYNSTVLHGIPIATMHPPGSGYRSGRTSSASSIAGSLGRTRSMTSIHSAATASSFGMAGSRQSSRAGSRPTSAKKSTRERPPWNDRW